MNTRSLQSKSYVYYIEMFFFQSWWVVIFILLSYAIYEHAMIRYFQDYNALDVHKEQIIAEKQEALTLQKDLLLQIASHEDQDWVELTLIKGLGVIPRGQKKVIFVDKLSTAVR
jgi:hypothetical protein